MREGQPTMEVKPIKVKSTSERSVLRAERKDRGREAEEIAGQERDLIIKKAKHFNQSSLKRLVYGAGLSLALAVGLMPEKARAEQYADGGEIQQALKVASDARAELDKMQAENYDLSGFDTVLRLRQEDGHGAGIIEPGKKVTNFAGNTFRVRGHFGAVQSEERDGEKVKDGMRVVKKFVVMEAKGAASEKGTIHKATGLGRTADEAVANALYEGANAIETKVKSDTIAAKRQEGGKIKSASVDYVITRTDETFSVENVTVQKITAGDEVLFEATATVREAVENNE